jgi:threonine/homoserine/homoserine lactone efflux protein
MVEWNRVTPFWEGVLAGYGIAIPVGAIAILIVDTGLRRGFTVGFMAGAGAAAADFIYASLAALTGEALASLLTPYATALRVWRFWLVAYPHHRSAR